MSFDTWLKQLTSDRILRPVRRAIAEQVPPSARVLELGFGTGALLFELSPRIREGVGLELAADMLEHARARAARERIANLRFERQDALDGWEPLGEFDVATATLVVHELPDAERVPALRRMAAATEVLVADYATDQGRLARLGTHFDELLAGHRERYVSYESGGGMPPLFEAAGLRIEAESPLLRGGLRVWRCSRAQRGGASRPR